MTRRAVVTGASGAIGGALVRGLGDRGYDVSTIGRRPGPSGDHVTADLAEPEGLAVASSFLGNLRGLDVLVHAAGDYARGGVADVGHERLRELLAVNAVAPYALTRAALPALRRSRGSVVFVNSSVSRRAGASVTAYAATKHALKGIADGLRAEEGAHGVSVLSVFAGRTAGDLQRRLHDMTGVPYDESRLLRPEDVATAVLTALESSDTAEVTEVDLRPRRAPG